MYTENQGKFSFVLFIVDVSFQIEQLQDANVGSGKKIKKALYTPSRGQFDQGNPDEYFDQPNRIITLDNLGMNLPSKSSFRFPKRNHIAKIFFFFR